MHMTVGSQYLVSKVVGSAVAAAYPSPGFRDEQYAGRHIPGFESLFKISVQLAGSHIGQIDGGRPHAPEVLHLRQDDGKLCHDVL